MKRQAGPRVLGRFPRLPFGRRVVPLVAVVILPLASGPPPPTASERPQDLVTEVVLIGTIHSDHLLIPQYSLTHLRALLDKIDPDAVGVETRPAGVHTSVPTGFGDGVFIVETFVAKSWGARASVPVIGVSWWTDPDSSMIEAMRSAAHRATSGSKAQLEEAFYSRQFPRQIQADAQKAYGLPFRMGMGRGEARITDTPKAVVYGIEYVHREGVIATDSSLREQLDDEAWGVMEERDDRIAELILELARQYPGGRIAVIHGMAHYMPLVRRLSGISEIRVVPTADFLPLSEDELAKAWHREDALATLGVNLDSWGARAAPHARDQRRTVTELNRLVAVEPGSAATLYYRGRWNMLFQNWDEAELLLDHVREGVPEIPLQLPVNPQWRWPPLPTFQAMATFALGNLHDLGGAHESAIPYYRELLASEPQTAFKVDQGRGFYIDLRVYLESLIAEPYQGGPRELLRSIEAMRAR